MKSKTENKKTPSRKVVISNPKAFLKQLDKLQKYRNGVKCNRTIKGDRYSTLTPFTGHLLFQDVIALVDKFAEQKPVTAKKTTTRTK